MAKAATRLRIWAAEIDPRWAACNDKRAIELGLVLPFIDRLGYDVLDPSIVTPGSTGSTTDVVKDNQIRIDFSVRRRGVPALLVATYGAGRTDAGGDAAALSDARRRVEHCLGQSSAALGAATNGRSWDWAAKTGEGRAGEVRWYARTDVRTPNAEDELIVTCLSNETFDSAALRREAALEELTRDGRRGDQDPVRPRQRRVDERRSPNRWKRRPAAARDASCSPARSNVRCGS